jgi:hypothetical protein
MHGNVWEWCLDDWHDNYEGTPQDGSAEGTPQDGSAWAAGEERLGKSSAADPDLVHPTSAARPTAAGATRASAATTGVSASVAADQRKVLRGGSWFGDPHICRSAYRGYSRLDLGPDNVGFRVCLASNPAPAASQEAMADAREESQAAAIEPTPPATAPRGLAQWFEGHVEHFHLVEAIGAMPQGELAPIADTATLLRQHEADLATTREALRRLVTWGGFAQFHVTGARGFDCQTVCDVAVWFADGMTGFLPPLPPHIARHEGVEPTPSAPALPPATAYDGGGDVVICATNRVRTNWAVRDGSLCLNFSGEWVPEPYPSIRSADFLTRTRWPSADAAWAALLAHRASKGVQS